MKRNRKFIAAACACALLVSAFGTGSAIAAENVTTFTFTDNGITVTEGDSTNYKIEGTQLTINGEGSYLVTGSCSDGQIKVKKGVENFTLTLSELTLSGGTSAPLVCNKNTEGVIAVEGTVTLSDTVMNSEDYLIKTYGYEEDSEELDDTENAVIKLKDGSKITMTGDGTLNINASAKNGIKSGATMDENGDETAADPGSEYYAYLCIDGPTINIDADNVYDPGDGDTYGDGINAESYLSVSTGTLNVNAGDDGIHCDYTLDIGKGAASDSELSINIDDSEEGIEGAVINIYNGNIDVSSNDDAINAANSDLSGYQFEMNISGGTIDAVGGDDGLDSNGTISISGGSVTVQSGMNGIPFDTGTDGDNSIDSTFRITGGEVLGIGSNQMAVTPSTDSQGYVTWGAQGGGQGGGQGGFGGRGGFTGQDGTMPTPPENSDGTMPTPPENSDDTMPTPPENSDGTMPTPPENSDGTMPTPPENSDGTMPTPPENSDGTMPTPPENSDGTMPTRPGGDQGGGSSTNLSDTSSITLTNGTQTGIAVGSSVNISSGNEVAVVYNGETLASLTADKNATYVIYSAEKLEKGTTGETSREESDTEESGSDEKPSFDTNGDGSTDIADSLMIARADAGLTALSAEQLARSDANKDGMVDIADSLMIARIDAGLA